jgi:hypothetical protein
MSVRPAVAPICLAGLASAPAPPAAGAKPLPARIGREQPSSTWKAICCSMLLVASLAGAGLPEGVATATPLSTALHSPLGPSVAAFATAERVCPPPPALATGPAPAQLGIIASRSEPIDHEPLLTGFGAVWSASSSGLVELSTPTASPKIVINQPIDDIALAGSSVFALSRSSNQLLQFDPHSLHVTRRWSLRVGAWSIAASPESVYIAFTTTPVSVDRVDLGTDVLTHAVVRSAQSLSQVGRSIAFGDDAVWIVADDDVYRLDPTLMSALGPATPVGTVSDDVWFGDGSLWTASQNTYGGVDRIDPANGCIVARAHADAIQIAFLPHAVWLSAAAGPRALDPMTAATTAIVPPTKVLDSDSAGIAVVGDEVWADYGDIGQLQRIELPVAAAP